MSRSTTFVIAGAGLAGAKTAEALRDNGFDGRIVLFGDEERLPYERPPLSKEFLAGKKSLSEFTVHPPEWYRDHVQPFGGGIEAARVDHRRQSGEMMGLRLDLRPSRCTAPSSAPGGERSLTAPSPSVGSVKVVVWRMFWRTDCALSRRRCAVRTPPRTQTAVRG